MSAKDLGVGFPLYRKVFWNSDEKQKQETGIFNLPVASYGKCLF